MKTLFSAALALALLAGSARADECADKAAEKSLAGAAKTSFLKKCRADVCAPKAVDKNGKPLAGAARSSFMKKCEKESAK